MSNNYYEDLDARFALDPALIESMREFGILYDREEGGEFYHLYTPVYGSRVFFEVVLAGRLVFVVRGGEFGGPHDGAASRKSAPSHVSNDGRLA